VDVSKRLRKADAISAPFCPCREKLRGDVMSQYYVGVKIVFAWPEVRDGKEGYAVKYPDGYTSWSPKEVFEASYLPMGESNDNMVTPKMVDSFFANVEAKALEDGKTTMVGVETVTGFRQYETSSCVDPANFDLEIGKGIAVDRVRNTLWKCLGFVVQWGRSGLKAGNK
jgi:hypothetical protein